MHMPAMSLDVVDKLPVYRFVKYKQYLAKYLKDKENAHSDAEKQHTAAQKTPAMKLPSFKMPSFNLPSFRR